MMKMPQKSTVERLRKTYPKGTRVRLVHMDDPYCTIPEGTEGTVEHVDDIGTIHIAWDNGSSLGAVYGEDVVVRVD